MWKNIEKQLITSKLRCAFFSFPLLILLLYFHIQRHTFATSVCLSQGVPIETVSKMLGHKHITTTHIYAKITNDKIKRDMENLQARIGDKFRLAQ